MSFYSSTTLKKNCPNWLGIKKVIPGKPPVSSFFERTLDRYHQGLTTPTSLQSNPDSCEWLNWLLISESVCSWEVLLPSEKVTSIQHFYDFEGGRGAEKGLKKILRKVSNLTLRSALGILSGNRTAAACAWGGGGCRGGGTRTSSNGGGVISPSSSLVPSTARHFFCLVLDLH